MAKNYFNRYVWLIDTINRYGHITLPEISQLWENSALNDDGASLAERTFHNHRRAIEEVFGLEIGCDRSLGYYIEDEGELGDSGLRQWLFESLSVNSLLNESRALRGRVLFENIPSSQKWLSLMLNAIKDERAVEMTYQSFNRSESHSFIAHPYCLKLFRRRWYVLARSVEYNSPRVYSLDRIVDLKQTEIRLDVPANFDAKAFFADYFGIIVGDNVRPSELVIRAKAEQAKYLESLPLHPSQRAIEVTPEYSVFQYLLVPTFDLKQEILSRGSTIEVIAPDWFRDEIVCELQNTLIQYVQR
ncbi:MAG: WYL domain-containing protein [Bacteroidales bacterium]|nr:WYL domain-containing protein [Bacteroidales bacterium]